MYKNTYQLKVKSVSMLGLLRKLKDTRDYIHNIESFEVQEHHENSSSNIFPEIKHCCKN